MTRILKNLLLLITISTIAISPAFANETFKASSNKTEVATDEEFILTFEYEGKTDIEKPDFDILKNSDLNILGTNQSFRKHIVNSDITFSKKWQISVTSDKEEGEIIVPSISIEDFVTKTLKIKINNSKRETKLYKIYNIISEKKPYINQQIDFSIIIETSSEISLNEPYFTDKNLEDWIIIKTKQPEIKEGINKKISFFYAIFPQKIDEITLPTAKIDAYIESYDKNLNTTNINSFVNLVTRPLKKEVIQNPKEKIVIKPAIKNSETWLPAKKVEIASKWNTFPKDFKSGEIINREIVITAIGNHELSLPKISLQKIDETKQYPNNPQSSQTMINGEIHSMIHLSNNYIFNKEGNFTIPEEIIYWFNIDTKKMEKTILPKENIYIKKGQAYLDNDIQTNNNTNMNRKKETNKNDDYKIMIASFLAGAIITCVLLLPKRKKSIKIEKETKNKKQSSNYIKNIINSAKKDDYKEVEKTLILWAIEKFGKNISSLQDIKKHIKDDMFVNELDNISKQIYAPKTTSWNSQNFLQIFEKICKEKPTNKEKTKEILPKLYK